MEFAGYTILGFTLALQLLLFWRCIKVKIWKNYPFLFSYFGYTLFCGLFPFVHSFWKSQRYAQAYWLTYLIASVFRFAVAWEVFRQAFPGGSPLRRYAISILTATLCGVTVVFYLSGPQPGVYFIADFIRKISLSVVVWLLIVLGLARYYAIPLGRNVWGMAVGLLIFVSSQILSFAAVDISPAFRPLWTLVVPFGFVVMIFIWTCTLWSYAPNPKRVVPNESMQREALLYWRHHWANLDTAVQKVLKP